MVELSSAPDDILSSKDLAAVKSKTDIGTITLHWLTVISMIASLITGLRISVDGQFATWSRFFAPILPQGQVWTIHLIAGLTLLFSTICYYVYAKRSALIERNSSKRLRTFTAPTTRKLQWRALNVALHWFAYAAILALIVSGLALYWGFGNWFVTVHRAFAWMMLFYILIHSIAHFMYGGLDQLLRLFRPQNLVPNSFMQSWPIALALSAAIVFTTAIYAFDQVARPSLQVAKVTTPPILDGQLDEAAWQTAASISMRTHQGANLGGSGTSTVTTKAFHDGENIHFAFRWQDPTRSLMRSPTVKFEDGWRVIATDAALADVNDYYEDKFAVLFSLNDEAGGGDSTYLGKDPLPAYPSSPHKRGLHYTDDGRIMDLWQWKSSRGGMLGHVDDMHFGPPKAPSKKQMQGKKRYAAGYDADPGKSIYEYNYITDGPKGYNSPVRLKRLPVDLASMRFNLGEIPKSSNGSNSQDSQWWMTLENSVPYSSSLDAKIPVGTILPSTLNIHTYSGDRADLSGGAKWKDGYWTLEVSRKMTTGSPYDISFYPNTKLFFWVSVFDHNQTRHTRHQRAIELFIE